MGDEYTRNERVADPKVNWSGAVGPEVTSCADIGTTSDANTANLTIRLMTGALTSICAGAI
jgi:hypothetical protein